MASKPRPFRLTHVEPGETARRNAIEQFLNYHPKVAWVQRLNVGAGKLLRADGTHSQFIRFGFPGLTALLGQMRFDGRLLVIETKARIGTLTPEQIAFMVNVQRHGGVAGVARTIEDAAAIIAGRRFEPGVTK
ncbi:hypothetical protein D3C85_1263210 [compost metagenome]